MFMDQKIQHLNIVKMPLLLKLMYRFNEIPMKISTDIFLEIGKLILKLKCKNRGPIIAKTEESSSRP